ncbi:hypothetical protein J3E69DRAFT_381696 [Trichoderma sp. SZMC 28015]
MTRPLNILILGGVGAQNSHVAKELAVAGHKVRILTRDTQKRGARELAALPGIEIVQGDTYDEETLEVALRGIQSVYVNTNGFAIGERSEIYWSIRIYEIAYWAGVKHFVYSTLPYVSRRSGFNPKFRVPFVDGKAKFAEYLKSQPTNPMNWSLIESGPYAEDNLYRRPPTYDEKTGEWVWRIYLGEGGCYPLVDLPDFAWFARYILEHPEELRGDLLSVGIKHTSGKELAEALTATTGKPSRYVPLTKEEFLQDAPPIKIGAAHSPGYDDPTLWTAQQMFLHWSTVWIDSVGNTGLWTRDYERLDTLKPDRIRTVAEWMKSVGYDPEKPKHLVNTGMTVAGVGEVFLWGEDASEQDKD